MGGAWTRQEGFQWTQPGLVQLRLGSAASEHTRTLGLPSRASFISDTMASCRRALQQFGSFKLQ